MPDISTLISGSIFWGRPVAISWGCSSNSMEGGATWWRTKVFCQQPVPSCQPHEEAFFKVDPPALSQVSDRWADVLLQPYERPGAGAHSEASLEILTWGKCGIINAYCFKSWSLKYLVAQKYTISTKGNNKYKIFWARTNLACLRNGKNANVVGD